MLPSGSKSNGSGHCSLFGSFLSTIPSIGICSCLLFALTFGSPAIAKQKQKGQAKVTSQSQHNDEKQSGGSKSSISILERKNAFDRRTWAKRGFITRTYGSVAIDGGLAFFGVNNGFSVMSTIMAFDFGVGQEFIIKLSGKNSGLIDLYFAAELSNRTIINGFGAGDYHVDDPSAIGKNLYFDVCAGCSKFNYYNNFGVDLKMGFLVNRASSVISKFGFYAFGGVRFNATSNLGDAFPSATISPVPTVGVGSMIFFKRVPDDRLRMSFEFFCDPMQPINMRMYVFDIRHMANEIWGLREYVVFGLRTGVQYSF